MGFMHPSTSPRAMPQQNDDPQPVDSDPTVDSQPPADRTIHFAISGLYLFAATLPTLIVVAGSEPLLSLYEALFDGRLTVEGIVFTFAVSFTALLGLACLVNGLVRLVIGERWSNGACAALALAAAAFIGLVAMIAIWVSDGAELPIAAWLYLSGTLIAVVAAIVGAIDWK